MTIPILAVDRNFYLLHKRITWKLGVEKAFFLGQIQLNQLNSGNDFFPWTIEEAEKETGLSKSKQAKFLKEFEELGILEIVRKGLPRKRYLKISEQGLYGFIYEAEEENDD